MPFKLLKRGDSGIFVEYLQYGLHIMCFKVKPFDGIFGTNTYKAVINFQNLSCRRNSWRKYLEKFMLGNSLNSNPTKN